LELCISARLRILNGRFIGDSLGYYTYMSLNGYSTVDYAVISEGLLSSVQYFKTDVFNYLSDHIQIQVGLKCRISNLNDFNLLDINWQRTKRYRWKENSKELLIHALSTEDKKMTYYSLNSRISWKIKQV